MCDILIPTMRRFDLAEHGIYNKFAKGYYIIL